MCINTAQLRQVAVKQANTLACSQSFYSNISILQDNQKTSNNFLIIIYLMQIRLSIVSVKCL